MIVWPTWGSNSAQKASHDLSVKEAIAFELCQGFDAHETGEAIPLVQNLFDIAFISQSANLELVTDHTLDAHTLLYSFYVQESFELARSTNVCPLNVLRRFGAILDWIPTRLISKKSHHSVV